MEKKISLSLVVLLVVLVGPAAFYLGYSLKPVLPPAASSQPLANLWDSKLLSRLDVSLRGKISVISGQNVTIENEGKSFVLALSKETVINQLPETADNQRPTPKTIELSDLKVGDVVEASLTVSDQGSLVVMNVALLPASFSITPVGTGSPRPSVSPNE